ncbi:hypothetical protein EUGRSUZ_J00706 [Eucalyptus grandis]|uniref:Uncharacterized protein n=2 Tax=Eucalyptus grandis TaxID=71139 RepID=A0ACC3J465_EUCGR|nr:hypothetical protein EUGRSUZ_J00706 [Eucalyptus grandis]
MASLSSVLDNALNQLTEDISWLTLEDCGKFLEDRSLSHPDVAGDAPLPRWRRLAPSSTKPSTSSRRTSRGSPLRIVANSSRTGLSLSHFPPSVPCEGSRSRWGADASRRAGTASPSWNKFMAIEVISLKTLLEAHEDDDSGARTLRKIVVLSADNPPTQANSNWNSPDSAKEADCDSPRCYPEPSELPMDEFSEWSNCSTQRSSPPSSPLGDSPTSYENVLQFEDVNFALKDE